MNKQRPVSKGTEVSDEVRYMTLGLAQNPECRDYSQYKEGRPHLKTIADRLNQSLPDEGMVFTPCFVGHVLGLRKDNTPVKKNLEYFS